MTPLRFDNVVAHQFGHSKFVAKHEQPAKARRTMHRDFSPGAHRRGLDIDWIGRTDAKERKSVIMRIDSETANWIKMFAMPFRVRQPERSDHENTLVPS